MLQIALSALHTGFLASMVFHAVLLISLRVNSPLTIDVGSPRTLKRVTEVWVPELQRLGVKVPLLLVGCKSDLRPQDQNMQQVRIPSTTSYSIFLPNNYIATSTRLSSSCMQ